MRLTLRTLLAYLDDTLPSDEAKTIGEKVAESESARELIDRIRKLTRKRGLSVPANGDANTPDDPNVVSDYLSDTLFSDEINQFEEACLNSDVNLAEVASCHQILTLLMSEPMRVPPTARQRMYQLVKGPESLPNRKPGATLPIGGEPPEGSKPESFDADATLLLGVPALAGADTGAKKAFPVLIGLVLLVGMLLSGYLAWPKSAATVAGTRPTAAQTKPGNDKQAPVVIEEPKREMAPPPRAVVPN
ncbi:MAG TPA: hypothetical protein VGJ05_17775 [Fimbriiglobus sp.]|jgi:hypothetical protein